MGRRGFLATLAGFLALPWAKPEPRVHGHLTFLGMQSAYPRLNSNVWQAGPGPLTEKMFREYAEWLEKVAPR